MKYRFNAKRFAKTFARDWQLHLLMLVPVVYIIIFDFIPMYGIQIAFRDFRPGSGLNQGLDGSQWVGLKWFADFLSAPDFLKILWNTIAISLYSLATFPLPVMFALVLNALKSEKYKKTVQTVSYMPYFISTTVMVGIIYMILSPMGGVYGNFYGLLTGARQAPDIRYISATFSHLYVWSGVWQTLGWNSIIYMAALSSVSQELHEAAMIDGASRLKRMWYVDIPAITPTIAIMLILRATSIIGVGAEKVLLMQSPLNTSTSEVISTFIFKKAIGSVRSYSYGGAVGLFQTAINLGLLFSINAIVKKATDGEVSLY